MTTGYNAHVETITPDELRDAIIAARQVQGIGQAQAAAAAGISQPAWSLWESGQRGVTLETLARMAAVVGIEVAGPVLIVQQRPGKKSPKKSPGGVDRR